MAAGDADVSFSTHALHAEHRGVRSHPASDTRIVQSSGDAADHQEREVVLREQEHCRGFG
jgi:hypothetical protein